ncbi:MAG: YfiR family protein [candidate division Zixibacteria bacterium]|nr:YfiR family protein [candidate division Zixibacteria bacterium]
MKSKIIAIALFLLILLFPFRQTKAKEKMPVPPRVQIPILLKVLTYNRNFEKKVGDELVIGILYDSKDDDSKKVKQEVSEILDSLSAMTVKGVPFFYVEVEYNSEDSLRNLVKSNKIDVLYIAPGGIWSLKSIVQISQKYEIPTMTGITDYVKKGISVGIGLKENKPEIWVNLDSAKAEGSNFSANLLKLCKVIR